MKAFKDIVGDVIFETMTIAELRAKLAPYPDQTPVLGEWDGMLGAIQRDSFESKDVQPGESPNPCSALVIRIVSYG